MAFNTQAGPSSQSFSPSHTFGQYRNPPPSVDPPPFDILEWYPHFQSCHRYFLDHAQHTSPVQALAAFLNIQLPFQKQSNPIASSNTSSPRLDAGAHLRQPIPFAQGHPGQAQVVSLIPYIRRLVATGHDTPGVLHGLFGDNWSEGIGNLHEVERRNFLFAAKSTNWLGCKQAYDMSAEESVPFLSPLKHATEKELASADASWGAWLEMQDWMLGPRAPDNMRAPRVKREPRD